MGLDRAGIAFLVTALRLGVRFDESLMLGRQWLLSDVAQLRAAFAENGLTLPRGDATRIVNAGDGYAEPLLTRLGARRIESLDASDYENSTLIHDLNDPLPANLESRFSVVIDGGTLEHVFDFPAALGGALNAIRPNGHFLSITPANGWLGHGFYQFSPELFYRVLAPPNGFRVICILLRSLHWRSRWRAVPDPADMGGRVVWRTAWPTLLYVLAKKVSDRPARVRITQSDYESTWAKTRHNAADASSPMSPSHVRLPLAAREFRESWATWRYSRSDLRTVSLRDLQPPAH